MNFQNLIFDLDGTLIDSAQITGQIIDEMFRDRAISQCADRDLIRKMDAVGGEPMIAAVMGQHSQDPAADLEEFRTRHRTIEIPETLPFPDVVDALNQLALLGVKMAICSNKPETLCKKILGDLNMDHFFVVIVGSKSGQHRKPNPQPACIALAALGAKAEHTLFCGDSLVDIATAKSAGMDACLVSWGYGTAEALASYPNAFLLRDTNDLISLVEGRPPSPYHGLKKSGFRGSDPMPFR